MRYKRLMMIAAILSIGGTAVSGCMDGRPGYDSDRHHGGRHHGGRDHDGDRGWDRDHDQRNH